MSNEELASLYESRGLEPLAKYLGVSKNALRKKLISMNIIFRSRGGANFHHKEHCKLEGITLQNINENTAEGIAELRNVDISLVYKLKRRLTHETD